jgi:cyclic pyranopterin phosphate synthase
VFGPGFQFLPARELLSFEEIARLSRIFVSLGVQKLRLTGGEPLVRRDLPELVRLLPKAAGLDLALTTNGSLLAAHAEALAKAGLERVTVSLDSLDDATFRRMNDAEVPVQTVLDAIAVARAVGLRVKINAVIQRGVNDQGLIDLARYFRERGIVLRLIEYMDVGNSNGWDRAEVVSAREMLERIDAVFPLEPAQANYAGEVARRYRYRDGSGEIGVIASVTEPFCGDCSRARLSAQGSLYTCLFASEGHDLRRLVRSGQSDAAISGHIAAIWQARKDAYSEQRGAPLVALRRGPKIEMSYIGG